MKQILPIEVHVCDVAECARVDPNYRMCLRCKKEFCSTCAEQSGVRYPGSVTGGPSEADGFYCHPCNGWLTQTAPDALHANYRIIARMRQEYADWTKDFLRRAETIERALEQCRMSWGLIPAPEPMS